MENSLENEAVRNLLNLCDQDLPALRNNFTNPQYRILSEQTRQTKTNTSTFLHSYNCTMKVKTQQSAERTLSTTQNKENLKRILEKLRDSPSPVKIASKKKEKERTHVKTLNSQPQSRMKQPKKTPDLMEKSLIKMLHRVKEKDLIKTLVKAKIVQKLKGAGSRQTDRMTRQQGSKISTLREIQGLKRGQMALRNQKKESISYYNLLRDERAVNMSTLISGKNSRVNIKHLLF